MSVRVHVGEGTGIMSPQVPAPYTVVIDSLLGRHTMSHTAYLCIVVCRGTGLLNPSAFGAQGWEWHGLLFVIPGAPKNYPNHIGGHLKTRASDHGS